MSQKISLSWETSKKILEMLLEVEKDIKEKVNDGNNLLEKYLENIDEIIKKFNRRLFSEEFEFIELTENEYNSYEKLFVYKLVQLDHDLSHTKFELQLDLKSKKLKKEAIEKINKKKEEVKEWNSIYSLIFNKKYFHL